MKMSLLQVVGRCLVGILAIPVFAYAEEAQSTTLSEGQVAKASTSAVQIVSSTHPDQYAWYQATTTAFSWELIPGTKYVRISISPKPDSVPTRLYDPPITEKIVGDVADGIWYFHLQIKDAIGWSDVSHFRVQIDSTVPERFSITEVSRDDQSDPNPTFVFDAFDALSGISGYEVSLDGAVYATVPVAGGSSSTQTSYQLKDISSGDHALFVRAMDRAGNSMSQEISFHIEALPAPTFVEYTKDATERSVIVIKGTSLPDAQVTLFIAKDGVGPTIAKVVANQDGAFVYGMFENVSSGTYTISAQTISTLGAKSATSDTIEIVVKRSTMAFVETLIFRYVPTMIVLSLFLFVMWLGWHKFKTFKKEFHKEAFQPSKKTMREAFGDATWKSPKKDNQYGAQIRIPKRYL